MKKNIVLLSVLLVYLVSCSSKKQVDIGISGCYILQGDEKEASVNKASLNLYEKDIKIAKTQSYINKHTISDSHKKYFSFVLADVIDVIVNKVKSDSSIQIIEQKKISANEKDYFFFKVRKTNGLLLVKVLFNQPLISNSIVMDAVCDNEDVWNEFYSNADSFTTNLNCKNEDK